MKYNVYFRHKEKGSIKLLSNTSISLALQVYNALYRVGLEPRLNPTGRK